MKLQRWFGRGEMTRGMARSLVVAALSGALGCMRWTGAPLTANLNQPVSLRLRLRDGTSIIVKDAVVSADSIVGVPWGGAPRDSRIAVARAQVARMEIGETDGFKTAVLVGGIVLSVFGGLAWLARHAFDTEYT